MKAEQASKSKGGFFVTIATSAGSTTKKVEGDVLTVGRADDCNLTIAHETLSRRHLTVTLRDGFCWIEDHASSNGTFINGKRVRPHVLTRVLPEDQITMGQAEVRLSVSAEPVMRKEGAPPLPAAEGASGKVDDTIVTTTSHGRHEQRKTTPLAQAKPKDEAQDQAERLLQDAQKKAVIMIQEAEVEAERRVEDIYRRAHETQAKMDEVYQRRMNEAYRASEQLYQKSQEESQKILDVARQKSTEIRQQAENFVMELRKRTEEDCERMLEEAQQTARDLKEQRLLEAEEVIKQKEDEVVTRAREVMDNRMVRFEEDLSAETERRRHELERQLENRQAHFDLEHKNMLDEVTRIKTDLEDLKNKKTDLEKEVATANEALFVKKDESVRLDDELAAAKQSVVSFNQELNELRTEIVSLEKNKQSASAKVKELNERIAHLTGEAQSSAQRVKVAQEEAETQTTKLRAKMEDAKVKIEKDEGAYREEVRLQTTRKIRELELKLAEELQEKKERIGRELSLHVEKFLKENPQPQGKAFKGLQDQFTQLLEQQVVTITQDESAKTKQASLVSLKRRQKWMTAISGAMAGALLLYAGQAGYQYVQTNASPIERSVAAAQEARKADLEARKFNPPQTKDFKATYVDNVLYTQDFVQTYISDDFQKKMMKKLVPFMLRTWKTDEDTVIQLLGITSTLVNSLQESKNNIHPDFVPQGIQKMRDTEKEALLRMQKLLGSHVRVESFKRFEKQFYQGYIPPPPPPSPASPGP